MQSVFRNYGLSFYAVFERALPLVDAPKYIQSSVLSNLSQRPLNISSGHNTPSCKR